jgi:hypothetical protein
LASTNTQNLDEEKESPEDCREASFWDVTPNLKYILIPIAFVASSIVIYPHFCKHFDLDPILKSRR